MTQLQSSLTTIVGDICWTVDIAAYAAALRLNKSGMLLGMANNFSVYGVRAGFQGVTGSLH